MNSNRALRGARVGNLAKVAGSLRIQVSDPS